MKDKLRKPKVEIRRIAPFLFTFQFTRNFKTSYINDKLTKLSYCMSNQTYKLITCIIYMELILITKLEKRKILCKRNEG